MKFCQKKLYALIQGILNFFYPTLCLICSEKSNAFLCPCCFDLLAPPNPDFRCRHCFRESAARICTRCLRKPFLSAPRAVLFQNSPLALKIAPLVYQGDEVFMKTMFSFCMVLWSRLNWPTPYCIIPLPSLRFKSVVSDLAREFASLLSVPFNDFLELRWEGLFRWKLTSAQDCFLENRDLLLIDFGSDLAWQRAALREIQRSFPRSIHIFSIFETNIE